MFQVRRGNKYNNRKTIYNGILYDSAKEADHAKTLNLLKKAFDPRRRVVSWERQVRLELRVYGSLIATYRIDFDVTYADGHRELQEVKGFETDSWKLKWKLFEAIYSHEHPEIDLVVIK